MAHWFSSLRLRWKLQIAFLAVTMATTVYNRLLATWQMDHLIDLARDNQASAETLLQLESAYHQFVLASFWESGLQFAVQFIIIGVFATLFVRPILNLRDSLKAIEKGDLTQEVKVESSDEIGELQTSFNAMLATLNRIIGNVDHCAVHMGQSAYQIAAISHEIEGITQSQEARSGEVMDSASAINHFSNHVRQIASETNAKASATEARSLQGIRLVQSSMADVERIAGEVRNTAEKVNHLQKEAASINGILAAIHSIAEQTNLLALNAAIEAARAGESGRGFAVVADEVRNLASRTSRSAAEVNVILAAFTSTLSAGVSGMDQCVQMLDENRSTSAKTLAVLEDMGRDISETAQSSQSISGVIQEQVEQYDALRTSLNELFETLRKNSLKISNTANISDALFKLSERLNKQLAGLTYLHADVTQSDPLPAGADRRQANRTDGNLLVSVHTPSGDVDGLSLDLSLTGMSFCTKFVLPENRKIRLQIRLPQKSVDQYARQPPLEINGDIVWNRAEDGKYLYGIRFVGMNDDLRQRLQACQAFFTKKTL